MYGMMRISRAGSLFVGVGGGLMSCLVFVVKGKGDVGIALSVVSTHPRQWCRVRMGRGGGGREGREGKGIQ